MTHIDTLYITVPYTTQFLMSMGWHEAHFFHTPSNQTFTSQAEITRPTQPAWIGFKSTFGDACGQLEAVTEMAYGFRPLHVLFYCHFWQFRKSFDCTEIHNTQKVLALCPTRLEKECTERHLGCRFQSFSVLGGFTEIRDFGVQVVKRMEKKKLDALSTVASGFEAQLFDLQPSSGVVPKDNSTHCFMLLKTQQL